MAEVKEEAPTAKVDTIDLASRVKALAAEDALASASADPQLEKLRNILQSLKDASATSDMACGKGVAMRMGRRAGCRQE